MSETKPLPGASENIDIENHHKKKTEGMQEITEKCSKTMLLTTTIWSSVVRWTTARFAKEILKTSGV